MSEKRSLLGRTEFWLGLAGAAAVSAGVAYYLYNREDINYYLRLLRAQRRAEQFYKSYPRITKSVAYCDSQTLDVYQPETDKLALPVLIYVYGGSWIAGNKELYAPAAQLLLPHEMIIVLPNYTLHPKAHYYQQVSEVADSIAWTRENIEHFGGDPRRIVVAGQSAGAQLGALALFDEAWLRARGHRSSEIAGFLGISGPYDLGDQLAHERSLGREGRLLLDHFEGEENLALASPLAYLRAGLPPARLIHGDADTTVPLRISEMFHAALLAYGNQSELKVYEGGKHSEILFDALTETPSRLIGDMAGFITGIRPVPEM